MRSSLIGSVLVVLASALLGSCGGGGAASPGPVGGPPQILPATGTLYGGVEYTFTVAGGRPPYNLSSSEPALLPVPATLDGNFFTVTPANPGVYDVGLADDALPVRSVTITSRDTIGNTAATSGLQVAINFMTGYGVRLASNCAAPTSGAPPGACAGGETVLTLSATINGNLHGNRQYRFEVVRGPFFWVFPNGQIAGNVVTVNTDHQGNAIVMFRVNPNIGTQIAVFRVVDVLTGASTTHVFTISGVPLGGALQIIPNDFTFTGRDTATCGTGTGDFLVFDGTPPYTAISTTSNVQVTPNTSSTQPGRFTLSASNPFICLNKVQIVVTDSVNSRAVVTVTTEPGTKAPPPTPISVTPGSLTLACGTSGSVSILGGGSGGTTTTFSVSSADSRITAAISGRTVTVGRSSTDPVGTPVSPTPGTPNPIAYTVTVTDGSTSTTIGITAPSNCPP